MLNSLLWHLRLLKSLYILNRHIQKPRDVYMYKHMYVIPYFNF